jgi:hypothetical protein
VLYNKKTMQRLHHILGEYMTTKQTQNAVIETHLRGTGRTLTASEAKTSFGIKNLRARMSEIRQAGLIVKTETTASGKTSYSIPARSASGSRAKVFAL